ncbi:hypothetical protein [Leptospira borgpetersenii]|uniref:Uncharacterized protein n=2 Tax=Leptospira borgpetersenii TaxID=174 RepID=M6BWG1_LEPBO|nr:hypothetical protein [Leptospira borgpetersenii]EMJ82856.1 hypothetical protein LEP1GSC016_3474 [Leptospira borgpetersenii serovar Hardjo-bovis str. Sponselee]EMO61798.1 hypothetical protein LEP1GSC133_2033 [Leptospira borgpetersenii serovar Pomona str. 200901868]MBE8351444.1 hypothetical protein [Leptospira borgpetersenii serovar Hardjo-bovis]MBE8371490.1 hypothetical protein [Leptospira borgpetersenii serovar Hardjo-bovis]MBE8397165.1 hypothetical protein [Leptospira borgpetersenii serova
MDFELYPNKLDLKREEPERCLSFVASFMEILSRYFFPNPILLENK